jgi:hypothetical protein
MTDSYLDLFAYKLYLCQCFEVIKTYIISVNTQYDLREREDMVTLHNVLYISAPDGPMFTVQWLV